MTHGERPPSPWPTVANPPDLPALDRAVLARWAERDVFAESLRRRAGQPAWTFYEGPPTANGRPGVHHVEARTFKDVFPRYQTMKGRLVERRAGWDCHGLPVELEVERALGLASKADIESYGIGAFNDACRASVLRYVDAWKELTERVGYWVDLDGAYWTMDGSYTESVWWALQRMHDQGLLFEDFRVSPYCGRCGTALSDAEVAQGYQQVADESVYVRFPVLDGPLAEAGASLLIWTTTPWTLPGNVAVAVGPDLDYELVATPGGPVVVATANRVGALGEDAEVIRPVGHDELIGHRYRGPFDFALTADELARSRRVVAGAFVTAGEGSGLVHIAPAFGADDMAVGRQHDLPTVNPVDLSARFSVGPWAGQFVRDADPAIVAELDALGVLVRAHTYEHTYPFCWRCKTALIYYAKPSWYIRTTAVRDRLLRHNAGIDWHPAHIRDGRFGNWLENNVDWALSRDRYWGTPLPFWRCGDCDHVTVVGSRAELGERAGRDLADLDLHRPAIDEVTIACPQCGGTARRVTEVADAWLDSGAMPFAQWGHPHRNREQFEAAFPAAYVCEAIDQTRGWFYTLLAVSTLLFDRSPYDTVLCLGHIVDESGRKMSKSLGNILDPIALLDEHGADALRWAMVAEGSAWGSRRIGPAVVEGIVRRFFLTLWNTHYFFATYAGIAGFDPSGVAPPVADRPLADRALLADTADLVEVADRALAAFDASAACQRIEAYVDHLSNWYVRTNRRRFWKNADEDPADSASAYHTLYEALVTLVKVVAPLAPFVADQLWEDLVRAHDPDALASVHLADFPEVDPAWVDAELRRSVALVRRVVEVGRQGRAGAGVPNRQPLARAVVSVPAGARSALAPFLADIGGELNIRAVTVHDGADQEAVDHALRPRFDVLGPRYGRDAGRIGAALRAAPGDVARTLAQAWAAGGPGTLDVDGQPVELDPDVADVLETPRTGWHIGADGDVQVALDTEMDESLLVEGAARQVVRAVNQHRKDVGLQVTDRIELALELPDAVHEQFARLGWAPWIADEVLAVGVHPSVAGLGARTGDPADVPLGALGAARIALRVVAPA